MARTPEHSPNAPPELSATDARAGARKSVYRILMISTLLALVVLSLVWLAMGGLNPPASRSQQTTPGGEPAPSVSTQTSGGSNT